ncbi:MAG: hypothetical protein ACEY3J_04465 [Arsenophonus sp.]
MPEVFLDLFPASLIASRDIPMKILQKNINGFISGIATFLYVVATATQS